MKEQLLEICHKRLAVINDCIEDYESYYQAAEMDMFSPVPTNHQECESIGKLLKEFGSAMGDYELIGIGQTFVMKSELLLLEEAKIRQSDYFETA